MTNKIIFTLTSSLAKSKKTVIELRLRRVSLYTIRAIRLLILYHSKRTGFYQQNACRGCRTRNQPAKGKRDIRSSDAVLRA